MKKQISAVGDLTQLAKDIEEVFKKHFGGRPGLAIAFTLPPAYKNCHWVTNLSRTKGIDLLEDTAKKMQAQQNWSLRGIKFKF